MRLAAAFVVFTVATLKAHVGSPDVFYEGQAGPYPVSIAIRPPTVIPGIAEVEIRTAAENVRTIHVVPFPLVGTGSKYPPTPDLAKRSSADSHSYTSSVWLMAFGSYQVRVDVEGAQGRGSISVPVPSIASETKAMQPGLGWVLAALMALIVIGMVSIAGAVARESTLPEGELPGPARYRRSRIVMAATTVALVGILAVGNRWWVAEASSYRSHIYMPPALTATVEGSTLHLKVEESRWAIRPKLDDYLPDHGHLMHLFLVRMPQMDRIWHLHPDLVAPREFTQALPPLSAGHYKLFADVVHASGFPETPVADLDLSAPVIGEALRGDDAEGVAPPLSAFDPDRTSFSFADGYRMVRLSAKGQLPARQLNHFTFEVQDSAGHPATDLEPYMGMAGHAEFLLADGSVFAHVHPSGTVPMSALGLTMEGKNATMDHSMRHTAMVPAQIMFPYGFPKAGRYRMFIQVQRSGTPRTASFDFNVSSANP